MCVPYLIIGHMEFAIKSLYKKIAGNFMAYFIPTICGKNKGIEGDGIVTGRNRHQFPRV
jgi:hypothetical protein